MFEQALHSLQAALRQKVINRMMPWRWHLGRRRWNQSHPYALWVGLFPRFPFESGVKRRVKIAILLGLAVASPSP